MRIGFMITRRQGQGLIDVEDPNFALSWKHLSALYQSNGALVLVEGHIERAGEVRVMYYRISRSAGKCRRGQLWAKKWHGCRSPKSVV